MQRIAIIVCGVIASFVRGGEYLLCDGTARV